MAHGGPGVGTPGGGGNGSRPKGSSADLSPAALVEAIAGDEAPRHRLLRCGAEALSDAELLAALLGPVGPGSRPLEDVRELLHDLGGFAGLADAGADILELCGLGRPETATLLAAREIACRLARVQIEDRALLDRPAEVANYLSMRYSAVEQEVMGVFYLDVRHRLIAETELYRGTLYRAAVEPRAILKHALLRRAPGFILFHNHPSGDPSPSAEDLKFTRRMAEAGELLGVRLVDHVIIGGHHWVSLSRRGVF